MEGLYGVPYTLLDTVYARLDGVNMPFTGDVTIQALHDESRHLYLDQYSHNNDRYGRLYFRKSQSNTAGTVLETLDGTFLGNLKYMGVNTSDQFAGGCYMSVQQIGDSGDYVPTRMEWATYSATGPNDDQFVMNPDGSVYVGTGFDFGIGTTKWNSGDDIDALVLAGTIPADVLQTEWDSAYSHIDESGASHTYINQDVTSGSSPTFDGTNFTGIPDGALATDYVEVAGDTMTGGLTIQPTTDTLTALVVNDTDSITS